MKKQCYHLLAALLSISLQSYIIYAHASPVEISLQQAIDSNCDGITEEKLQATPGACIIYSITTTNNSNSTLYNLNISGRIPEYTRLYQPIILEDNMLTHKSTQIEKDNHIIKSQLGKLEPGENHAVVLRYAVQVL